MRNLIKKAVVVTFQLDTYFNRKVFNRNSYRVVVTFQLDTYFNTTLKREIRELVVVTFQLDTYFNVPQSILLTNSVLAQKPNTKTSV